MDDDIVNSENYLDMGLMDEEIEITPEIIDNTVNTTPIVADIADELTEKESEPPKNDQTDKNKPETVKFTQLPLARIKTIMKMDPDVNLASSDAVFAVTKATELFIDSIAKEAYSYTAKGKRKIITKKDLDAVIDTVDCLCFLEGAMDI